MSTQPLGIILNGVTGRMGTNQHLIRSISDHAVRLRGRVGIVSMSMLRPQRVAMDSQLAQADQVIGHATDFVQVAEPWRDLAWHLLGTTWFVRSIEVALQLRDKALFLNQPVSLGQAVTQRGDRHRFGPGNCGGHQENNQKFTIGEILIDAFDRINERLEKDGNISGLSSS